MLSDNNNWQALILPFLYLGDISLQVRARLRKSSKVILICCKVQIVFKSKWKRKCFSGVLYKCTCGRYNFSDYGRTDRYLKIRSAACIGISPLTFRKLKPSKEIAIREYLLRYNTIITIDNFYHLDIWSSKIYSRNQRKLAR